MFSNIIRSAQINARRYVRFKFPLQMTQRFWSINDTTKINVNVERGGGANEHIAI